MVMAARQWCYECESETLHHNNKCTICAKREKDKARDKWNALTYDEKIEALVKRVERLENNVMY
jgi:hypothetical protein